MVIGGVIIRIFIPVLIFLGFILIIFLRRKIRICILFDEWIFLEFVLNTLLQFDGVQMEKMQHLKLLRMYLELLFLGYMLIQHRVWSFRLRDSLSYNQRSKNFNFTNNLIHSCLEIDTPETGSLRMGTRV